jgi:hypothetical protein
MTVYADRENQFDSDDEAILTILCWGPWIPQSQEALIEKVMERFSSMGTSLDLYSPGQLTRLVAEYRFKWQKAACRAIVRYLKQRNIRLAAFRGELRRLPPLVARGELQIAVGMKSAKIVDCLMRDWLLLDAFPIDSRIAEILKVYEIPSLPTTIVAVCTRLDIPVRVFARAAYGLADQLP